MKNGTSRMSVPESVSKRKRLAADVDGDDAVGITEAVAITEAVGIANAVDGAVAAGGTDGAGALAAGGWAAHAAANTRVRQQSNKTDFTKGLPGDFTFCFNAFEHAAELVCRSRGSSNIGNAKRTGVELRMVDQAECKSQTSEKAKLCSSLQGCAGRD
jgi:hypothetical protein